VVGAEAAPDAASDPRGRRPQRQLRAARRFALSTPVLALVIALTTWGSLAITPGIGLDSSWAVALQMATHRGLDWGTQIVFTYGPLGFLTAPVTMYGGLTALAGLYSAAVVVGLAAAFLWATRSRGLPLALAFALAFIGSGLSANDQIVPLVFICCAVALRRDPPPGARALIVYGGAVLCAVESLVKLNIGLAVMAMVLVTVLALPGRRALRLARFGAVFVATFALLWFATGQGLGNFDDYVRTSFEVISGYSSAMVLTGPGTVVTVALVLFALALVAASVSSASLPTAQRAAAIAIVAILCFAAWKEAFVRQEPGHVTTFYAWTVAPWAAVVLAPRGRWLWVGLAGFVATAILYFWATDYAFPGRFDPVTNARTAINQMRELLVPGERENARDSARFTDALLYGLDDRTRREIGDRPVDIYPWNASLAWALGMNWRPLPVFQSYTAYTPYLDRLDAAALASPDGPALVLRHLTAPEQRTANTGLDDRYGAYDEPAASLAMLCNFRPERTTPAYELLTRTPDRCGPARKLGSVETSYGASVRVPPAQRRDDVVYAKVSGLAPAGIERLRALLYRAAVRYVVFDRRVEYRIVAANAGDGLLISAPRAVDFPGRWALAPNARTVGFDKEATFASPADPLHIDFYAIPVRPLAARALGRGAGAGSARFAAPTNATKGAPGAGLR
jgi:hypothetical protein